MFSWIFLSDDRNVLVNPCQLTKAGLVIERERERDGTPRPRGQGDHFRRVRAEHLGITSHCRAARAERYPE